MYILTGHTKHITYLYIIYTNKFSRV